MRGLSFGPDILAATPASRERRGSPLTYRRMTRVLHVLGGEPDLETRASLRTLRERLDPRHVEHHSMTAAGATLWSAIRLRRHIDSFDVIHTWDERAFAAVALAGARRIVFTTS